MYDYIAHDVPVRKYCWCKRIEGDLEDVSSRRKGRVAKDKNVIRWLSRTCAVAEATTTTGRMLFVDGCGRLVGNLDSIQRPVKEVIDINRGIQDVGRMRVVHVIL